LCQCSGAMEPQADRTWPTRLRSRLLFYCGAGATAAALSRSQTAYPATGFEVGPCTSPRAAGRITRKGHSTWHGWHWWHRKQQWPLQGYQARSWRPRGGRTTQLAFALQAFLEHIPERVVEFGPLGPFYFFCVYVLAECLAVPATPLTLSSGFLFGLPLGTALVLSAGTCAACIGFALSRTLLRPQISKMVASNTIFRNINLAVEREGFKIILLLRLSPMLPFSLSTYFFGLSNVRFTDFFAATFLGFMPGTFAFVYLATTARGYLGSAGAAGSSWYGFAAGLLVTAGMFKAASRLAQRAIDNAVAADKAEREAVQSTASTGGSDE